jgi:hypothetical protein
MSNCERKFQEGNGLSMSITDMGQIFIKIGMTRHGPSPWTITVII